MAETKHSSDMVERLVEVLGRLQIGSSLEEQAVAALVTSHHAELVEALEKLLAEARERGGAVTEGEHLGCQALRGLK